MVALCPLLSRFPTSVSSEKKNMVKCKYLQGDLPQSLVSSLDLRGREIGRCELWSLKNQDSNAESHGMNIKVDPLAKGWKERKTHPSLGVCSSQAHATLSNALPLGDNQSTESKAKLLKQHHRNIQKWCLLPLNTSRLTWDHYHTLHRLLLKCSPVLV